MTFADLVGGESLFVDANILVFHFDPHPLFGSSCTDLLKRVELQVFSAYTSTHVLGEVAHRLMTLEAGVRFGWPTKIVDRLKRNPAAVQQLVHFRSALQRTLQMGIQVLPITTPLVDHAAGISQSTGLLTNDAMIVAVMRSNGLTNLASNDGDFDRVQGLIRMARPEGVTIDV
jgi:predicted nucleic acid-binding protein